MHENVLTLRRFMFFRVMNKLIHCMGKKMYIGKRMVFTVK